MTSTTPLARLHSTWLARESARTPAVAPPARPGAATGTAAAPDAVEYLPYGPADDAIPVPAAFGPVELEYAAIRRGGVLIDAPHRGLVRVTGADRLDLLERLLTQALGDAGPGDVRQGFLLTRQGRIIADLTVLVRADEILLELDAHQAAAVTSALDAFVFTEDVQVVNASDVLHRFTLLGHAAADILANVLEEPPAPGRVVDGRIAGKDLVVARLDAIGEPTFEFMVAPDDAPAVAESILAIDVETPLRACGWFAWNVARVEHGLPMFNIDFGPTSLPHETGLVAERVSFRKGCYPGQEIVARLENLGQPKQCLVGLQVRGDVLPQEGSPVHAREAEAVGPPVGVVTSSTLSPMLGRMPIAIATLGREHASIGDSVMVSGDGEMVEAVVAPRPFWVR